MALNLGPQFTISVLWIGAIIFLDPRFLLTAHTVIKMYASSVSTFLLLSRKDLEGYLCSSSAM